MSNENVKNLTDTVQGREKEINLEPVANQTLEDVAVHDFFSYEFLIEPTDTGILDVKDLSVFGGKYIDKLQEQGASFEMLEYTAAFLTSLESVVHDAFKRAIPSAHNYSSSPKTKHNVASVSLISSAGFVMRQLYLRESSFIMSLLDRYGKRPSFLNENVYSAFLREARKIHNFASGQLAFDDTRPHSNKAIFSWFTMDFGAALEDRADLPFDYPFEIYPSQSVNFGIAVTYRQRWKTLGIQRGEVVKTIPLGPGQTEKVTTKITRRKKMSRNMESTKESETSTETTDTTKDSSEIVGEASDSFKWNVNAEAGYSGFGYSAKVSAGMEGSQASSSKETTSNLSEAMKKTASKLKSQTKLTVMTESESSFEQESFSEIHNPNDELALTYFYHSLQHQYEVFTYLAEVRNVVFVAERVPSPAEINATWVRKYDWILIKSLKDESFSNILNELIQDLDEPDLIDADNNHYEDMLDKASINFAQFKTIGEGAGQGGLSVPDIYSEPQQQFDRYLREKAIRRRSNRLRDVRRKRLYDHIRQNILHYCRAIWAAEDNDQRLMRYRKEGRTASIQWQGNLINDEEPLEALTNLTPTDVSVPLQDILDPTGPIGFTGNYIVFPLRPIDSTGNSDVSPVELVDGLFNVTLPLQEVLNQVMRAPYASNRGLHDPSLEIFVNEAVEFIDPLADKTEDVADTLFFKNPTDDMVFDFLSFMPDFTDLLIDDDSVRRILNGQLENPISARDWGHYLHRKNATRRFLVDSNNLYIGIHVGEGTALEPFKHAHRYIDVLHAAEKLEAEKLKNARREAHTLTPGEYDPDISKVVIAPGNITDDAAGTASGDDG